jgi:ZIP family zinc transporter
MIEAFLWGGLAACSLLIGFALGACRLSSRTIGLIMGFGAGALISALAYELVPESVIEGWEAAALFAAGALVFFGGDWLIDRGGGLHRKTIAGKQHEGSGGAIFLGTLLDAIPESLVLGMGLAMGGSVGVAFIAAVFVSNLPEGVAGTVNLAAAGHSRHSTFWMWVALVLLSAGCSDW